MAVITPGGGSAGIKEYLEHGQKAGREMTRDEMDRRVVLDGDLEVTDKIINSMDTDGEKYLHFTISVKERELSVETLSKINQRFKSLVMAAYGENEFDYYAEAHLSKIKGYFNSTTGELVEKLDHIHIVIPKTNLLTNKPLNPTGLVEHNLSFLDAIQETINQEFNLASPKDNPREGVSEADIIKRARFDDAFEKGSFNNIKDALKEKALSIGVYDEFKAVLSGLGEVKAVNAGKANEYLAIKPKGQDRFINLRDQEFRREYIEQPATEKQQRQPEKTVSGLPRKTKQEYDRLVEDWTERRAKEIKYINTGGKFYQTYKKATKEDKRELLAQREANFYQKIEKKREGNNHDSREQPSPGSNRNTGRNAPDVLLRQSDVEKIRGQEASKSLHSVRALPERNVVFHKGQREVLLQADVSNKLEYGRTGSPHQLRRDDDRGTRRVNEATGRQSDSVISQLLRDKKEQQQIKIGEQVPAVQLVKQNLDASRLLADLSKTHNLKIADYEITKGKDGSDRIQHKDATVRHNVNDFLTKHMQMAWKTEAEPYLKSTYEKQLQREPQQEPRKQPRQQLWAEYQADRKNQSQQRATQWSAQVKSDRSEIKKEFDAKKSKIKGDRSLKPAERKAALSIARMERVVKETDIRGRAATEREKRQEAQRKPSSEQYRNFLTSKAQGGDENALAELRRQRNTSPIPTGPNVIEGSAKKRDDKEHAAPLAQSLAYSIDHGGNVTYYADQTKRRALVIDSGQSVTVAAVKDSQAVEVGLRLAVQKFGPGLKIEGNEEFKRQVIDAVLKTGLRVEFDSKAMNDELTRRRTERDELQARGKAFIASERDKAIKPPATQAQEKTPEQGRTQQPEAPEEPPKQRDIER